MYGSFCQISIASSFVCRVFSRFDFFLKESSRGAADYIQKKKSRLGTTTTNTSIVMSELPIRFTIKTRYFSFCPGSCLSIVFGIWIVFWIFFSSWCNWQLGQPPTIFRVEFSQCKLIVTPSVLRSKQITKPYHERHVYVIMHMMEWIDKVLQPKMINKKMLNEKLLHNSCISSRV